MKVTYKDNRMVFMTALQLLLFSMIFLVNHRDPTMRSTCYSSEVDTSLYTVIFYFLFFFHLPWSFWARNNIPQSIKWSCASAAMCVIHSCFCSIESMWFSLFLNGLSIKLALICFTGLIWDNFKNLNTRKCIPSLICFNGSYGWGWEDSRSSCV